MTQQHPITPPPELVQEWVNSLECPENWGPKVSWIAARAAQWGADQELEACCALMDDWGLDGEDLMECRRPKPPSLKEQALDALTLLCKGPDAAAFVTCRDTIRRALESIPD